MCESRSIAVINSINPLMEALLYCGRIAKGATIAVEIAELKEAYPESVEEIGELFEPIITLEERLDKLAAAIEPDRLHYFFDDLSEDEKHPRGFNIANTLLMPMANERSDEMNFLEYAAKRRALSQDEMLVRMRAALAIRHLVYFDFDDVDMNRFFDYVNAFPASDSNKLRMLSAARNYKDYIEELYSMLQPLVEAIAQSKTLYAPMLNRFAALYSSMSIMQLEELITGNKYGKDSVLYGADLYGVYPVLFNIGRFYSSMYQEGDDRPVHCNTDISILFDKTAQFKNRIIPLKQIANNVKALSDPTRLQILSMLRNGEVYVQELTERLGLSFTTVSHHMTKLMMADLVCCERRGSCVYYSANEKGLKWLMDRLNSLFKK